jgi:hypothetical protein
MSASMENITKSQTQAKLDILERAAEIGTVYLEVCGREQRITVTRENDGGFSILTTANDPYQQISSGERVQYSRNGRFTGGISFSQNERSLEERTEPVLEQSAEQLLKHLDRVTGKVVMGSSQDPYAGLSKPRTGNFYLY